MSNPYKNTLIEFHILQSFPVTCLNRDDVGAPKSARVGGVTRARVSSQCWKRAVRMAMRDFSGVELGIRTKMLSDLVAKACVELGADEAKARVCGDRIESIFIKKAATKGDEDASADEGDSKTDTLLFLAPAEIKKIAARLKEDGFDLEKVFPLAKGKGKDAAKADPKKDAKVLEGIVGKSVLGASESLDGLDIALFGRMVAQATSMDVQAAASFSHAISTHRAENEIEFFTAVADYGQDQGSAHMGSLEFNSATYYRYIALDLGQLYETMGGDQFMGNAIEAFIKALYIAVPHARQTTQAGSCQWDFARVLVRRGQGMQLSFETPVKAKDGGFLQPSIDALKVQLDKRAKLAGSLFGEIKKCDFGEDENCSIDKLIGDVKHAALAKG